MKVMLTIPQPGPKEPTLEELLAVGGEAQADRGCVVNLVDGLVSESVRAPPRSEESCRHRGGVAAGRRRLQGLRGAVDGVQRCRRLRHRGAHSAADPALREAGTDGRSYQRLPCGPEEPSLHERVRRSLEDDSRPVGAPVHYGMSGYVQNIVWDRFLEVDPQVDGFSDLQFPSVDDSIQKMHIDEEGAAEGGR